MAPRLRAGAVEFPHLCRCWSLWGLAVSVDSLLACSPVHPRAGTCGGTQTPPGGLLVVPCTPPKQTGIPPGHPCALNTHARHTSVFDLPGHVHMGQVCVSTHPLHGECGESPVSPCAQGSSGLGLPLPVTPQGPFSWSSPLLFPQMVWPLMC